MLHQKTKGPRCFNGSGYFFLHPDACKVKLAQCYRVRASRYLPACVCLATYFVRLTCILLLQPSLAAPLLHLHSGIIEPDVGLHLSTMRNWKNKIHCVLMQAVKYPEQDTSLHHRANTDTLSHSHPLAIQSIQCTLLVFGLWRGTNSTQVQGLLLCRSSGYTSVWWCAL